MILRKPYAFFIKHFKLFNILLTILEVYMIYKLSFIVQFFFEYASYPQGAVGRDLVGSLLTLRVFIVGIVIALFSLVLMLVLSFKKKPIKLYLFIFLFNVALVVVLFIVRNYLEIMQMQIIENRTAYLLRDFTLIGIIISVLMALLTSMRSLGFDIKSFQFGQDLHDLNISEEDNEEFELQLDVDSQGFKRGFNRKLRYFKYFLQEHKLALVIFSSLVIGFSSYLIYSRTGIYFNAVKVNQVVNTNNFSLGIGKSYITEKDYRGNTITSSDKTLIVVPIKIKANNVKEKLNVARFALNVNNNKFYHTTAYKEKLIDLGVTYSDSVINTNFENYILVFEIPKSLATKNMVLEYNTKTDKMVKFKVEKNNLDAANKTKTEIYELNKMINFKNEFISEGTLIISEYELNDKFKVYYNFCLTSNDCNMTYEYLVPNYESNYDKTILRLVGKIELKNSVLSDINLYDFINNYGTLIYTIDGEQKVQKVSFAKITPQRTKVVDTYYIEVLDEVKKADTITLQFNLRNNIYVYKIKQKEETE